MKKPIKILFLSMFILLTAFTQQDKSAKMIAHIKMLYLYNFTKYVEWPPTYRKGDFVIDVMKGDQQLISELGTLSRTKKVGSQNLVIKDISSASEITRCNILFVPRDCTVPLSDIIRHLKGQSTLLITERPGSVNHGSAINFVVENNSLQFELNKNNAEKYRLTVSTSLAALAVNK